MEEKLSQVTISLESNVLDITYVYGNVKVNLSVTQNFEWTANFQKFINELIESKNTSYFCGYDGENSRISVQDGIYEHSTYCVGEGDQASYGSFKCPMSSTIIDSFRQIKTCLS